MTEITLAKLNERTCVSAVRQEAARLNVNAESLLDSAQFYGRVTSLDPDAPGFVGRVREMVGEAAGRLGGAPPAASPQQQQTQGPRQWTIDDVNAASNDELLAAVDAGLLTSLGVGPAKRRR